MLAGNLRLATFDKNVLKNFPEIGKRPKALSFA